MKKEKIKTAGLVMTILSTIFGFANAPVAFDQMGYASIAWYILAAILFFLPVSLMIAEYGATFKEAKGGIYSWLAGSIGEKWAFIGTFIWLASWFVWLLSTSSKVWIPFSTIFAGHDATQVWHFFSLTSTQTIGLLAIAWIIAVTYFSSRGMDAVAKVSAVGGVFVISLDIIFILASLATLFLNHGQMEQAVTMHALTHSPNPSFSSPLAVMSFVVYAVFAYAGIESIGGMMDDIDQPEKTFPKGLLIATFLVTLSYALMIFLWGISTNWSEVLGKSNVNLGNITYVMMHNLGFQLGKAMGLSANTSLAIGAWLTRYTGLGMFISYVGAFFVLISSPLKAFVLGADPRLLPKKMTEVNKNGVPENAMWMQAAVVCVIIFLVSFGGSAAQKFYVILTNMSNVSTTVPYLFLVGAFPFFKKRQDIKRPFVAFRNQTFMNVIVTIVMVILIGGIAMTCLQPILDHDYATAFWTIIGPIFFGVVALLFYNHQNKRLDTVKSNIKKAKLNTQN